MFNKMLEAHLRAQSAVLSQQMQEKINDIVPVYNTGVDEVMDESIKDAYTHIRSAVDSFMKLVLQMELQEYGTETAYATLIMPFGVEDYYISTSFSGVVDSEKLPDKLYSPIGKMDYFVYRCICDIPNNPVQIFYRWVKQQCDLAHILITLSPEGYVPQEIRDRFDAGEGLINWDDSEAEGFADDILNDSILSLAGINDPLNLCRLDTCVSHIDEFFDSYGFHEGGVVL